MRKFISLGLVKSHTGSPVGQTVVDAIAGELLRGRSAKNEIALEASVDNLNDDLLVGEADNKAVLGCVVLVLGLSDQALAGIVLKVVCQKSSI